MDISIFLKRGLTFLLCSLQCSSLAAVETQVFIEGGAGKLSGFTQTPKGGNYHTTSEQRPSYKEMDLTYHDFFHAAATFEHEDLQVIVDYYHLVPSEKTVLNTDLLTHSQFIPKGSSFEMSVLYRWYQFGMGYHIGKLPYNIDLTLFAAANWVEYFYQFHSTLQKSHRDFNLLAGSVGFKTHYTHQRWGIDLAADVSLPISELVLSKGSVGVHYDFPIYRDMTLSPKLSVGWLFLDYEDNQTIPNHLRYQLAPFGSLGMSLRFG